jgi:thioredoxin 1
MVTITADNYEQEVTKSTKPVMIDVWASWCPPCRMMEPVVEELDKELGDQIVIAKLDADAEPELTQKLGVMSLPTFVMIKDGQVLYGSIGAKPKAALIEELTKHLGVKVAQ